MTWARDDRLLVAVAQPDSSFVAVVDPQHRRVLRRVSLPPFQDVAAAPGALAALLAPANAFGPARVAVVDGDGAVRTALVDGIQAGQIEHPGESFSIEIKRPGFAVDPDGRRAFVVGPDFTVATVDLDTGAVTYHSPSARTLAKNITGPQRRAAWLGGGMLAAGGVDFAGGDAKQQPAGLRLIDTRDWSFRLLDPAAGWFSVGDGVIVAGDSVFGLDGSLRGRVDLSSTQWLDVQGPYGYVCSTDAGSLERVVQLSTGTTFRPVDASSGHGCPRLLYGQSSN